MMDGDIAHYKLLEKLGEGAMGVVYKAEDTKLKRTVALKFLPHELISDEEAKARFTREAQTASALQHHNICTIHDIDRTDEGDLFISMDCYKGETLKEMIANGKLPVDEAVDIAIQISEGLSSAHEAEVVHRDIKPANIMVTRSGVVKILDFGLAKLIDKTKVTKTGTIMGTVAYISPEQMTGATVDHRSDIWSLGAVMYELLTGRQPFDGEYEAAVLYSIAHEEPVSARKLNPNIPPELHQIVRKAMSRNIDRRYQSMKDLATDLKMFKNEDKRRMLRKRRKTRAVKRTLLVLALLAVIVPSGFRLIRHFRDAVNVGRQSKRTGDRFVVLAAPFWGATHDARTEGEVMRSLVNRKMLDELGQENDIEILMEEVEDIPRTHDEAMKLGRDLGAQVVIWGEVIVLYGEVEIQPYLSVVERYIGTSVLSTDPMEARLSESNQIQLRKVKAEEIGNLALLVTGIYYRWKDPEKALFLLRRISPPTAQSLRWQGIINFDRSDLDSAERFFLRTVELNPRYTSPYFNLALTYLQQGRSDEAVDMCLAALEFEPASSDLQTKLGYISSKVGRFDEAEAAYRTAIELDPLNAEAHDGLGWVLYREVEQREEAVALFRKAIKIDPEFSWPLSNLGWDHYQNGRYDQAAEEFLKAIECDPQWNPPYLYLGLTYQKLANYQEAADAFQKTVELNHAGLIHHIFYYLNFSRVGEKKRAQSHIDTLALTVEKGAGLANVVMYYGGKITEEKLLAASKDPDRLRERQLHCLSYYFIGMANLLGLEERKDPVAVDVPKAMEYFNKCIETDVRNYWEYELARLELQQLSEN